MWFFIVTSVLVVLKNTEERVLSGKLRRDIFVLLTAST